MEAYEPFVTQSVSPVWGPKTYVAGSTPRGPFYPPSLPPDAERFYEPYVNSVRKTPSPKPSPSWDAVKRSGEIRMTPYEIENVTTFNYLGGRDDMAVSFHRAMDANVKVFPATCAGQDVFELERRWHEQGDFAYWSTKFEPVIVNTHRDIDVNPSIASTRTAALASFKGGYDFLTELAEARQGLEFVTESSAAVYSIFSSFFKDHGDAVRQVSKQKRKFTARDMLRHADIKVKRAGAAWLAYRYALMPLYYSYQSVRSLIEQSGNSYQTYRDRDTIKITRPSTAGLSNGLYEVTSGSIQVSSTVKARYSNDFLRDYVSNQVQWNPFATAWELVPFSFVLDWFVNVGDFIIASTSSDFSMDSAGCTAVKTHVTVEAIVRNAVVKEFTKLWSAHAFPNASNSCQKQDILRTVKFQTNTTESCRTMVIEHYVRKPFDLDASELAFNPSMNWKRSVDAIALSHSPLKNLHRRFSK